MLYKLIKLWYKLRRKDVSVNQKLLWDIQYLYSKNINLYDKVYAHATINTLCDRVTSNTFDIKQLTEVLRNITANVENIYSGEFKILNTHTISGNRIKSWCSADGFKLVNPVEDFKSFLLLSKKVMQLVIAIENITRNDAIVSSKRELAILVSVVRDIVSCVYDIQTNKK